MVRGRAREIASPDVSVNQLRSAAEVEAVEGAQRERRGEGVDLDSGSSISSWLEETLAECAPQIVEVAADDAGRVAMQGALGFMVEEACQLLVTLAPGKAEVQVVEHECALVAPLTEDGACLQRSSALACADGEVDAVRVVEWKAGQNGVAVSSALKAMFIAERHVRKVETLSQLVELGLESRLGPAFRDLLQKYDVRLVMPDERYRAIEPVATIDAAHAFVDVPSQDPDLHLPGCGLLHWRVCRWACMLAQPS